MVTTESRAKSILRTIMAFFFVIAGVNHFVSVDFYRGVMPPYVPWPDAMIQISGIAEILGGFGLHFSETRRWAGWGLIALLVAVMPVHIHMVLHGFRSAPAWILWLRIPVQGLLIAWVYWCCLKQSAGIETRFRGTKAPVRFEGRTR